MQFIRFAVVGGGATLVQYIAFWIGMRAFDGPAVVVSSAAYLIGSIVSYVLNYQFTFASDQPHKTIAPKFYLMVFSGWLLNAVLMVLMVDYLLWNPWVGQVVATTICLVWNFAVSRYFVFGEKP